MIRHLLPVMLFALIFVQEHTFAQNKEIIEGLKILNLVRANYQVQALELDNDLSKYAVNKAQQQVESLSGEIILSKDEVGLLFEYDEGLGNDYELPEMRFVSSVLNYIDIDCDDENKYDLFNQIVDEKSTKIGIGEYFKNGKHCITFVFDNYVYNEEKDSDDKN